MTDSEILDQFRESDDPFLTGPEIAESLSVTRQAVNIRLRELHEEGVVERKEAGSHAVGWWISEDS